MKDYGQKLFLLPWSTETPWKRTAAMWIAVLFMVAGKWEQPKHPKTDKLGNKNVVHIHNIILCQEKTE